ncbi:MULTISPECIES: GDP-mannose 4,6-dehydratase [Fusobacterium]|jgi:GDP-4-dehydro-6-deoxy-D-mannose reductase|uniref:GDP-mannose 4,6-dehydratase n=1 Tax=Fusobacterium TaxID=848 RepID=UPI000E89C62B|nr:MULTISPECIES: GDP-mannose 4,6-dehydratase [Fusobacterium]HBJ79919.1 GDP-mannose 4,6 dehydratase [Fusobacterium sp.]
MKKAMIIGAAGFVGGYLIDHLKDDMNWEVYGTKLEIEKIERKDIEIYNLDILNKEEIIKIFKKIKPDYVFNLVAQSSVSLSWKNPLLTVDINIKGVINILEAVREIDKYNPRIILIGSSEEYGNVKEDEIPVKEENNLRPRNIYAVTKVCQNMIGKIYSDAYGMDIVNVRAFNHIGPKQAPIFVVSDFCKQVAEIEKGLREPIIYTGNLEAKRDFTDVRYIVRAYSALALNGKKGETYNIGSGKAVSIKEILDIILKNSTKNIEIRRDEKRYRPIDIPIIEADIEKLKEITDWEPEILLEESIKEILDYWRKNENNN